MPQAIAANVYMRSTDFTNFLRSANAFCTHLETLAGENDVNELRKTLQLLLDLYRDGLKLQDVTIDSTNSSPDEPAVEYADVFRRIDKSLPFQHYWQVLDPLTAQVSETGLGDAADDLKDIYQDLKKSIVQLAMDSSIEKENAVWTFKFNFDHHFGDHCI